MKKIKCNNEIKKNGDENSRGEFLSPLEIYRISRSDKHFKVIFKAHFIYEYFFRQTIVEMFTKVVTCK